MPRIRRIACLLFALTAGACFAQQPAVPAVKNWTVPQYWNLPETNGRRQPARPDIISQTGASAAVLTFVAVTPCRILDTRSTQGFTGVFGPPSLSANTSRTIPIPSQTKCGIPSAPAYSLNLTVVPPGTLSFLSAWPDNQPYPGTSVLNDPLGTTIANSAVVPGGTDGGIQVYASNPTDLIVDINGYFVDTTITSGLTLPFFGSSSFGGAGLFNITNTFPGFTSNAMQSFAAIVGNGNNTASVEGSYAGNMGVVGQGGAGNNNSGGAGTSAGPGGIGVYALGGNSGNSLSGGAPAVGGSGVYAVGGTSGSGSPSGFTGGAGVYATGGTGGAECIGAICNGPVGGAGGFGVVANGGTGGPNGGGGIGIFAGGGAPGAGGSSTTIAALFSGNVQVGGTLTKTAGSFRIDHPQDPANKYLSHSFVESPDMMNIYNGNVLLDASGSAWIELPAWFEVLNRDFRYQLTAIGAPAPGLFVAEEIVDNRFKIAGGSPLGKISWTVTGIRQDPYANAHRIPVEEDKAPQEQGMYLHPELYGVPAERNVIYAQHPELLRTRPAENSPQPAPSGSGGDQ
jgi:hypothetical protein